MSSISSFFTHAKSDVQQDADKKSCHVMEKIIRPDHDLHFLGITIDLDVVNLALRVFALFGGRKSYKIVLPDQEKSGLLHQVLVRDVVAVEGIFPVKDTGHVINGHAVKIGFGRSVHLGMEPLRHFLHFRDGNIHREIPVEIMLDLRQGHVTFGLEIGNLRIGVYAGLCAASAVQFDQVFPGHLF